MDKTVTVLICTYKRIQLLDKCLAKLIRASDELPEEIVIVDGDNGAASEIIKSYLEEFPNIKFIPIENINLAVSRNIGLRECTKDIVAITDDDVIVSHDWIKTIKVLHKQHPQAGAIGGKIENLREGYIDKIAGIVIFPFGNQAGHRHTVAGANASYKREALESVGEYDETLFRGEDVDFNQRIIKAGYKVYYSPGLKVLHDHRTTWKSLFLQIFMYGRAYYLVRKKWTNLYCVYPHSLCGLKDIKKLLYFFLGSFYESLKGAKKLEKRSEKFFGYFSILACNILWRYGMINQMIRQKYRKE